MYHRLSFVAQERFFDEDDFVAFCDKNGQRFGLIGSGSAATVPTMNADRLCAAYVDGGGVRLLIDEWRKRNGYAPREAGAGGCHGQAALL